MEKLFLNKNIETFLKSQLDPESRLAQSLLFYGEENLGKLHIAKIFAKSILCENHIWNGCDKCNSCKAFNNNWHPDLKIFSHETHEVGEREMKKYQDVQLFLNYKPQISSNRILIIDRSEQMTMATQSTSLKLLEEPFPNSIIIVISSFASKLPETILSRLLPIRFTKGTKEDLKRFFQSNFRIKDEDLDFYLELGENKVGKIINLIENKEYLKEKMENIKILINILNTDFVSASNIIKELANKDNDLNLIVKDWLGFLHQILVHKNITLWEKHLKINLSILNTDSNFLRKTLRNTLQLQNYTANYNLNKKLMLETFYLTIK